MHENMLCQWLHLKLPQAVVRAHTKGDAQDTTQTHKKLGISPPADIKSNTFWILCWIRLV